MQMQGVYPIVFTCNALISTFAGVKQADGLQKELSLGNII